MRNKLEKYSGCKATGLLSSKMSKEDLSVREPFKQRLTGEVRPQDRIC